MALDIQTTVQLAVILAILGGIYVAFSGVNAIRSARSIQFFRLRRDRIVRGWRRLFLAIILWILAAGMKSFAEPIVYQFFPPSPTPLPTTTWTPMPTITPAPSISMTPSITETPSITLTPSITPTPHIPIAIDVLFEGQVTPNPEIAFSRLLFTNKGIDALYRPIDPQESFINPVGHLFAYFEFDRMEPGVQWTALWYRDNDLVYYETKPWDAATGGRGFTDWEPQPDQWLPGTYQVQIFVGHEWKVVGFFTVEGIPPTMTPTPTITPTPTLTPTITTTPTPSETSTSTNTWTPWPSLTPSLTWTPWPSLTPSLTLTPWPSSTPTNN